MTSSQYKGGSLREWKDKLDNGLFAKLKNNKYKVIYYGDESYKYLVNYDKHYTTKEVLENNDIYHPLIVNFVQISLAKNLPNFLTNESLKIGKEIGRKFFTFINPMLPSYIANIEKAYGSNGSVLKFKSFTNNIKSQDLNGEFTYLLLGFPHWPYAVDKECNYREPRKNNLSLDYYDQISCANKLLFNFFNKLKEEGRYNSSIIIILSDHGSHALNQLMDPFSDSFENIVGQNKPYAPDMTPYNIESLEAHARGLLLIKKTYEKGELEISNQNTQLLDIFPTIMGLISENNYVAEGVNIFDQTSKKNIKRKFNITGPLDTNFSTANYKIFDVNYNEKNHLKLKESKEFIKTPVDIKSFLAELKEKMFNQINFYYIDRHGKIIDDNKNIFTEGLGQFNHWGAWTVNSKVTIAFNPKPKKEKYKKFKILLTGAFINKENQSIITKVYVNKREIGKINLMFSKNSSSFPSEYSFNLSDGLIRTDNYVEVELLINGANSEYKLGLGEDKRLLGIGIKSIEIE